MILSTSLARTHGKRPATRSLFLLTLAVAAALAAPAFGQERPRARDLGVLFEGTPGLHNAITDVRGVEVGHTTLISGEGALDVGKGPVRTGVTAVMPRGKTYGPVFAGYYSLNGNGEMTGTAWVEESGFLEGPILITNTHSVGVVRDAVLRWMRDTGSFDPLSGRWWWGLPVVAETYDGVLNDINGFHVKPEHAIAAIEKAAGGPVSEGAVGGGTGMVCNQFKGGIGTSSRKVGDFTVGVLVQCNYGSRHGLLVSGAPVGREIDDLQPEIRSEPLGGDAGSIIVVVATDAPFLPHQLKRLSRRVPMGLGRLGGIASNGSGDLFLAFSSANESAWSRSEAVALDMLPNDAMSVFFEATVQAVEEAVVNAMVAAETMTGIDDNTVHALPHDRLRDVLRRYNRLAE